MIIYRRLKYSKDAVAIAKRLISEGADIVTDTNMALSGINKKIPGKIRRTGALLYG